MNWTQNAILPEPRNVKSELQSVSVGKSDTNEVPDLLPFLSVWPYDPANNMRLARGADGREIIVIRQPMGFEQYEIDGHPQGRPVRGMESLLDFHHARIDAAKQIPAARIVELTAGDCGELFREACAYYARLIILLRLEDWKRAERDAAQLVRLLEFVRQHAQCAEDRAQIDPWRPHISRIHAAARALMFLNERQYRNAFQTARDVIGIPVAVDDAAPDHQTLAEALLESIRCSLAIRPATYPHEESLFIRQDDFWTIRYHGHTALLKCTRGLQCLA